eukprot:scaffold88935_cov58-Phaeocystis_antarctica.AAC.2
MTAARVVWPCGRHGLGLISLRAARERLHPRMSILRAVPRSFILSELKPKGKRKGVLTKVRL